jgi:hypothetical protein
MDQEQLRAERDEIDRRLGYLYGDQSLAEHNVRNAKTRVMDRKVKIGVDQKALQVEEFELFQAHERFNQVSREIETLTRIRADLGEGV